MAGSQSSDSARPRRLGKLVSSSSSSFQGSRDSIARSDSVLSPAGYDQETALSLSDDGANSDGDEGQDGKGDVDKCPHIAIQEYGLEADDVSNCLDSIDIDLFHGMIPSAAFTAVYVAVEDVFKTLASSSIAADDGQPSEPLVRSLVKTASTSQQPVFRCDDIRAWLDQEGIQARSLPVNANCVAVGPIKVPCDSSCQGDGDSVTIGAVVSFNSTAHDEQIRRVVESLARSSRTLLLNRHLTLARTKEVQQRAEIVKLMRLTGSSFGSLPTFEDDQLHQGDEQQPTLGGSAVDEHQFFMQAAQSIKQTLHADGGVVVLDLATFKTEEAALVAKRRQASGTQDRMEADQPSAAPGTIVCTYSSSSKPIPLLASVGDAATSHFQSLSGKASRPLVARYLASVQSPTSDRPRTGKPRAMPFVRALLPPNCAEAMACPVMGTSGQPAFLIICAFERPRRRHRHDPVDATFLETVGRILNAHSLRVHSEAVDRAQISITQRMQHSLRTPLHSIVGICESAGAQLEQNSGNRSFIASIGLSAEALDATISDVLDYSVLAGIKEPQIATSSTWPLVTFRDLFDIVSRTALSAWRLHCSSKTWLQDDPEKIPPPPELIVTTGPDRGSFDATTAGGAAARAMAAGEEEKCRFDAEALTRITSKVVANALQATTEGLVAVSLYVQPGREGSKESEEEDDKGLGALNTLHLVVRDTGCGMSQDFLESAVFQPLTNGLAAAATISQAVAGEEARVTEGGDNNDAAETPSDSNPSAHGGGLSLSIISALMLRLGGTISAASKEGQGTKMDLCFPFRGRAHARAARDPPPQRRLEQQQAATDSATPKPKSRLRVAVISHKADWSKSFLAFCDELCRQFRAKVCGEIPLGQQADEGKSTRILDEAQLVIISGEATADDEGRREAARLLKGVDSRTGKRRRQVCLEVPNRAYSDVPSTLRPERKQVWIRESDDDKKGVPAIEIYRPFGVPDLEVLRDIFDPEFVEKCTKGQDQEDVAEALHKTGDGDGGVGGSNGAAMSGASTPTCGAAGKGAPSSSDGEASSQTTKAQPTTLGPSPSRTTPSSSPCHPRHKRRPFCVLVVEDNPLNLRILVTLLKKANIPNLVQARDGVEAVEAFEAHWPHVVLLDINMPRKNGFDAAREMRCLERENDGGEDSVAAYRPRIVAVTALSMESDKLKGFEAGVDEWLTKPLRLASLVKDVEAWRREIEKVDGEGMEEEGKGAEAGKGEGDGDGAATAGGKEEQ